MNRCIVYLVSGESGFADGGTDNRFRKKLFPIFSSVLRYEKVVITARSLLKYISAKTIVSKLRDSLVKDGKKRETLIRFWQLKPSCSA